MRNKKIWLRALATLSILAFAVACGEGNKAVTQDGGTKADGGATADTGSTGGDGGEADAGEQPVNCDPMNDKNCFEVDKGETKVLRLINRYNAFDYSDVDQGETTVRHVIKLTDLVGTDVVPDPGNWQYQIYGTDGYTFGGYATWTNIQHGYVDVNERRVVFEPEQNLPRAYRVKDSYRMVISPAGP